jgi:hypothetical protein
VGTFLAHPAVQGGLAPFIIGIVVAGLAYGLRLAGIAAAAGFFAAVYLIGNFFFDLHSSMHKIVALGMLAVAIGVVADLAFKPTRAAGTVLGALFGLGSLWAFWSVLGNKPLAEALVYGAAVAAFVAWTVATTLTLHADPVRAGAAGLGLGLGVGIGAALGASSLIGQYGMSLGAASGGFLVLVMTLGKRVTAGASLTLTASALTSMLGAAAVLLARVPWFAVAALGLVPLAVRLPLPERAHPATQVVIASIYALAIAGASLALAWVARRA